MTEIITRRRFLTVLTGVIAAPVVMKASSLMALDGEAADLWVRFQSWPMRMSPPDVITAIDRVPGINWVGGMAPLKRFTHKIEPHYTKLCGKVYWEFRPKPTHTVSSHDIERWRVALWDQQKSLPLSQRQWPQKDSIGAAWRE